MPIPSQSDSGDPVQTDPVRRDPISVPFMEEPKPRLKIRDADELGRLPAAKGYYLVRDGKRQGPLTREGVVALIQSAHVSLLDLGWSEGATGWRPLGDMFPGVRPLVRPPERIEVEAGRVRTERQPFAREILPALSYPFRGDGSVILGIGVGGLAILWLLGYLALPFRVFSAALSIFGTGYLFGSLQIVLQASSQGEAEVPKWPELQTAASDVLRPLILWISCILVCFGPALILLAQSSANSFSTMAGVSTVFALAGAFCFPMAVLAVAMAETWEAADVVFIFYSIRTVLWDYLLLVSVLALIGLTYFLGNIAAGQYAIAGVRDLWGAANFIYFGVVLARLLGVFYYSNSDRLDWF